MVLQIHLHGVSEKVITAIIFVISFIFICSRNIKWVPIGRPAAALVGATLMVFFGIVQPEGIGEAVNWDTIILLFGMMLISLFLEKNKIWTIAGNMLLHKCTSPIVFLIRVSLISAGFSAVLTNDTVCVTLTPVVIQACLTAKLPLFPYLMALATSANIGSAALPVGNPQNMIIATASGINFITFFKFCAIATVVGMAINIGLLVLLFRKQLSHLTIDLAVPNPANKVELVYSPNLTSATSKMKKHSRIQVTTPASPRFILSPSSFSSFSSPLSLPPPSASSPSSDHSSSQFVSPSSSSSFSNPPSFQSPAPSTDSVVSPRPSHILHSDWVDDNDDDEEILNEVSISSDQVEVDLADKVNENEKDVEHSPSVKEIDADEIAAKFSNYPKVRQFIYMIIRYRAVWVLLLVLAGFCAGFHMGFTVLLGTAVLILIDRQEMDATFHKIDWNLLIFFASLFILVKAFDNQFSEYAWNIISNFMAVDRNILKIVVFSLLLLVGSNILSNVPLVLILSSHLIEQDAPDFTWTLMAFVSTVAGNLTLLGSVANLIVAEKAKKYYQIGFWEYFKVGALSTLLVTTAGVPIIVLIGFI